MGQRWVERHLQISQEQAEAFISIDDNLETCAPLDIDDIVESVRSEEPIDEEEEPEEVPATSYKDIKNAINLLKNNMCSWTTPCDVARAGIAEFEAGYERNRNSNARQTSIATFFK